MRFEQDAACVKFVGPCQESVPSLRDSDGDLFRPPALPCRAFKYRPFGASSSVALGLALFSFGELRPMSLKFAWASLRLFALGGLALPAGLRHGGVALRWGCAMVGCTVLKCSTVRLDYGYGDVAR